MMVARIQFGMRARQIFPLLLVAALCACSTPDLPENQLTMSAYKKDGEKSMVNDSFNAALGPLEDLGLRKRKIPQELAALSGDPYEKPEKLSCDGIKQEIASLDVILGSDVDKSKAALSAAEEYGEVGGDMVHDAVVGFVRSQTSIIPLRSIVRKVTGADKHEKAVRKASDSGKLRRAYLRGLADAKFGDSCFTHRVVVAGAEEGDKPDVNSTVDTATPTVALSGKDSLK